jgi:hypothetical protein
MLSTKWRYAECRIYDCYAEFCYAEFCYAECRDAECCGAYSPAWEGDNIQPETTSTLMPSFQL